MTTDAPTLITSARDGAGALRTLAMLSAAGLVAGLFFDPLDVWANLLVCGFYLVGLALGGLAFGAIQSVTGAGWGAVFKRVPQALGSLLPIGSALVIASIIFGHKLLFPWFSHGEGHGGFKAFWLDPVFFFVRAAVYVMVWFLFRRALRKADDAIEATGSAEAISHGKAVGAFYLVVFGFTVSLASVDWIMSLEPEWYSTMFGVYHFAGLFSATIAAIVLLVIHLRRTGPLRGWVTDDHLHDLGRLLFAFSTFWMYIWFSQYMLIWYSNIPEESVYFTKRMAGGWSVLMLITVALRWVVPFVGLMSQGAKRAEKPMVVASIAILAGHWIDLYVSVAPAFGATPHLAGLKIPAALLSVSVAILMITRELASRPVLPIGDPHLAESIHHHV